MLKLPEQLWLFTVILLVHNTFGAMQDVAIDALACSTLQEHERGTANGMMFAGASIGQLIGGSGVLFLMGHTGFQPTFFFVAGCHTAGDRVHRAADARSGGSGASRRRRLAHARGRPRDARFRDRLVPLLPRHPWRVQRTAVRPAAGGRDVPRAVAAVEPCGGARPGQRPGGHAQRLVGGRLRGGHGGRRLPVGPARTAPDARPLHRLHRSARPVSHVHADRSTAGSCP